jgi:hypothetical protein
MVVWTIQKARTRGVSRYQSHDRLRMDDITFSLSDYDRVSTSMHTSVKAPSALTLNPVYDQCCRTTVLQYSFPKAKITDIYPKSQPVNRNRRVRMSEAKKRENEFSACIHDRSKGKDDVNIRTVQCIALLWTTFQRLSGRLSVQLYQS